jgi:hypothetical protein
MKTTEKETIITIDEEGDEALEVLKEEESNGDLFIG